MATLPIKNFLGLRTGISEPEIGTAGVASNFRRNRVRGQLELSDGYETKLTFSPTTYNATGIVPVAHKSFYVADQGGRTITVVYATFARTFSGYGLPGHLAPAPLASAGLFIRPYYNGSAWVDDWLEITEQVMAELLLKSAPSTIVLGSNTALPWPDGYLVGWTMVKDGSFTNTNETGFLVTGNTGANITFEGLTSDLATWVNTTTVVYFYRNVYNKAIPAHLVPQFRRVLDELRVTTGNLSDDLDMSVFYRGNTLFNGVTSPSTARTGTYGEYGSLNIPSNASKIGDLTRVANATTGLPAGKYYLKHSLELDDGQETELRDPVGNFSALLSSIRTSPGFTAGLSNANGNIGQMVMANDGTYIYALGDCNNSATQYGSSIIYKIDPATLEIVATYTNPTQSYGHIFCVGGYIYALFWRVVPTAGIYYGGLLQLDSALTVINDAFTLSSQHAMVGDWRNTAACTDGTNVFLLNGGTVNQFLLSNLGWLQSWQPYGGGSAENYICIAADGTQVWTGLSGGGGGFFHVRYSLYGGGGSALVNVSNQDPVYLTYAAGFIYCLTDEVQKIDPSTHLVTASFGYPLGLSFTGDGLMFDGTYWFLVKQGQYINVYDVAWNLLSTYNFGATQLYGQLMKVGSFLYAHARTGVLLQQFEWNDSASTFTTSGYQSFTYKVWASPGYFPRRGRYVNVYISTDNSIFYRVAQHDLFSTGVVMSASSVFDATTLHRFWKSSSALSITSEEVAAGTDSYLSLAGRLPTESGVSQYGFAITANGRTYSIKRSINGKVQKNRVYISAVSGEGTPMYDVLPNDVQYVLDVEYNDADQSKALGAVAAGRILVLKARSLVMLTPQEDGSHSRDIVATGIGIAGINSLVSWNEALYWLDHSGVWEFTANGLRHMSTAIDATLFALTDAQREAAFGALDPKNRQYRLYVNNVAYVLDLDDGEWLTEPGLSEMWFDDDLGWGNQSGTGGVQNSAPARRFSMMRLLSGNYIIQVPLEDTLTGFASWETSRVELPLERGYDGLLSALYIDYTMQSTSPAVTLSLYLDEASSPIKTVTLPPGNYEMTVPAPLAARCKTFRLRVSATVTSGQKLKIRRLGAYFNQIPVGGDKQLI